MAQQTAVEWLSEQIRFTDKEVYAELYETIKQAKAKEKNQIINAIDSQYNYDKWIKELPTLGEQYYNETYKP